MLGLVLPGVGRGVIVGYLAYLYLIISFFIAAAGVLNAVYSESFCLFLVFERNFLVAF